MRRETAQGGFEVRVRLASRFEPVDGRSHLGGRIAADERVVALVRQGVREADLDGIPVKLTEVDPWGGVLVRGVR